MYYISFTSPLPALFQPVAVPWLLKHDGQCRMKGNSTGFAIVARSLITTSFPWGFHVRCSRSNTLMTVHADDAWYGAARGFLLTVYWVQIITL